MGWGNVSGTDINTRLLSLYYQLLTGEGVNKQAFCLEHNIVERSFDRDIEDIRLYLSEEQPYCELKYDRYNNIYHLSHIIGKSLPGELVLFLVNVLLSQKCISKDEMEGILSKLIDVTEIYRSREIYEYVQKRINLGVNCNGKAIMKMHWDMERAIRHQNIIEMYYEINEKEFVLRQVKPIQLRIENGFAYLIAYLIDKQYSNPAFFRLDRIRSFKILYENFPEDIQKDYIQRIKDYDLCNMLAGEEISVTVKVHEQLRRVLCDIFPNSILISSECGYFVYKINTYKQGFLNWIMGQEKEVIVLSPEDIKQEIIYRLKEMLDRYEGSD